MLSEGPRGQFPRWRRSRKRLSVCSVLRCPDLWLQCSVSFVHGLEKTHHGASLVQREFRARFRKDAPWRVFSKLCTKLTLHCNHRSGHLKTEHTESLFLLRRHLGNWPRGPSLSTRSELLVAHEKLGQLPLRTVYVLCARVRWEINFLLTFETAPFFCVHPVYVAVLNLGSSFCAIKRAFIVQNYSPISSNTYLRKVIDTLSSDEQRTGCVISGFRREVQGNCPLLGSYATSGGNSLPKFRDYLPILSSRAKNPRRNEIVWILDPWRWDRQVVPKRR